MRCQPCRLPEQGHGRLWKRHPLDYKLLPSGMPFVTGVSRTSQIVIAGKSRWR